VFRRSGQIFHACRRRTRCDGPTGDKKIDRAGSTAYLAHRNVVVIATQFPAIGLQDE
jgi:hypothetical protein